MTAYSAEFQRFYELAEQKIASFPGIRTVGFGDVMLDRWWKSKIVRPNPESATGFDLLNPTLTQSAGGAGNVAVNIATLGGISCFVGVIGADDEAAALVGLLSRQSRVRFEGIVDKSRQTTSKTRFYSNNGIPRISFESLDDIDAKIAKRCKEAIFGAVDRTQGFWVEDYGKGVIQKETVASLIELHEKYPEMHIVFDPKTGHGDCYRSGMCTLLKPNWKETCDLLGEKESVINREDAVRRLGEKFECDVLTTLSGAGSIVYEKSSGIVTHIPTRAVKDRDVTGAGDTIVATLTLALSAGMTLVEAAVLANCAAGVVVRKQGTASVSPKELLLELKQPEMQTIVTDLFRKGALKAA